MSKPRIPEWQRTSTDSASVVSSSNEQEPKPEQQVEAPVPTEEDVASAKGDDRESQSTEILEQASRFLDDPTIRNAPREKKVAFLESKGVRSEDIETLLGAATQEDDYSRLEEAGERAWLTAPPKPAVISESKSQPRDIPPIVTYPEFLANTEKPPPLITTKRLLTTAYISGGLMAGIYGLSKYIIAPMTENLAESRHDFATHTHEQLKEFNERLGEAVSVDPASKTKKITDIVDDISEADSDPTELYHRDYGTQTTPTLSRRPSLASTTDAEPTVTAHENRLKIIKSHLEELESNRSNDSTTRDSLKTKVSDLTTYLSEMSYQNQYYSSSGGYYGGGNSFGLPGGKDGKTDQIDVLKNDIRAVKGVFLSARNFPAGGRSQSPMPTGRVGA
ncbi:Nn.00g095120.m01.CDS01 [Neocucurbitaria sp. VM-36]